MSLLLGKPEIDSLKVLEFKQFLTSSFTSFPLRQKNVRYLRTPIHYQVDEFSFKEMKTWGQSKIYCFVIGVNQENRETGGVQDSLV